MDSKKPWQSKTILLNAIMAIAVGLAPFIPQLSGVSDYVALHASLFTSIWGVLNMAIRFISKDKISLVD